MINERKEIARRQRRMVLQEKQQSVVSKQKQVGCQFKIETPGLRMLFVREL